MNPVYFRNQPLGCTATIIYEMFTETGIDIPANIAGLLCSAIISDTLMFRSPTCTEKDKAVCECLAEIAGIQIEKFGVDMFNAGSMLKHKSVEEIFNQDYKVFSSDNLRFGVGQITSFNSNILSDLKPKLLAHMDAELKSKGVDMLFFMLTNIFTEDTELLYYGKDSDKILAKAFKLDEVKDGSILLEDVVSRKKQVIPSIMNAFYQ